MIFISVFYLRWIWCLISDKRIYGKKKLSRSHHKSSKWTYLEEFYWYFSKLNFHIRQISWKKRNWRSLFALYKWFKRIIQKKMAWIMINNIVMSSSKIFKKSLRWLTFSKFQFSSFFLQKTVTCSLKGTKRYTLILKKKIKIYLFLNLQVHHMI